MGGIGRGLGGLMIGIAGNGVGDVLMLALIGSLAIRGMLIREKTRTPTTEKRVNPTIRMTVRRVTRST